MMMTPLSESCCDGSKLVGAVPEGAMSLGGDSLSTFEISERATEFLSSIFSSTRSFPYSSLGNTLPSRSMLPAPETNKRRSMLI